MVLRPRAGEQPIPQLAGLLRARDDDEGARTGRIWWLFSVLGFHREPAVDPVQGATDSQTAPIEVVVPHRAERLTRVGTERKRRGVQGLQRFSLCGVGERQDLFGRETAAAFTYNSDRSTSVAA